MQVGKYVVERKLGEGGFGAVFVARDAALDRPVALKVLHPRHSANADLLGRFLQEARAAARIAHPSIVTVYECGQLTGLGPPLDGAAFIAMELLAGHTIGERARATGRLPVAAAIELGRQTAAALGAAHAAGVVHRDLKPDNLFVTPDPLLPGGERVKVLDFGIAKLGQVSATRDSGSELHTAPMVVFGTPRYMSPEQCKSTADVDHRADIYSLGCILFELVTARPVFEGEPGELLAKHQLMAAPRASSVVAGVPVGLDDAIAAMLAKDPAARPQTMADVQRALERGAATLANAPATTLGIAAGESTALEPPPRPRRSGRIAVVGVVAASGAAVAIWLAATGGGGGARDDHAAAAPPPATAAVIDAAVAPVAPPDATPAAIAPAPVDAGSRAAPADAPAGHRSPTPPPPPPAPRDAAPLDATAVVAPPPPAPPDAAPCTPVKDKVVDPFTPNPCTR
jgi:serine/threonine-protein kinase